MNAWSDAKPFHASVFAVLVVMIQSYYTNWNLSGFAQMGNWEWAMVVQIP